MSYVLKAFIDMNNSRKLKLVKNLELLQFLNSGENFRNMDIAGFLMNQPEE